MTDTPIVARLVQDDLNYRVYNLILSKACFESVLKPDKKFSISNFSNQLILLANIGSCKLLGQTCTDLLVSKLNLSLIF
jgi:hypothetical protein